MDKASEILEKIKEKKVEPKSRWRFLLRDYMMWVFFGAAILVGSLAFGVIIFLLNDNDWDVYKYLDKSFASYLLLSLPYLWIIVLALFSFLAYFNYKHTKSGYKVNPVVIVLVSILISVSLGGAAFASGFGKVIDSTLSKKMPYYEKILRYRQNTWNNPEKGLLSGTITKIEDEDNFSIKDRDKKDWKVEGEDVLWRKEEVQKVGEKIKIIGEKKGYDKFDAQEVRPWIGARKHLQEKKKEIRREVIKKRINNRLEDRGRHN